MILNSPSQFIRDQISGSMITKVVSRNDGSYRYEMDNGTFSYIFNSTKFEELGAMCSRLGFKLRFAEGVLDELN